MIFAFFLFLLVSLIRTLISIKYEFQVNINIKSTIDSRWMIISYKKFDLMSCLIECNIKTNCLNVVFNNSTAFSNRNNCFLYKKYFRQNELVASNSTNLYSKECNPTKTFNDSRCITKIGNYLTAVNEYIPRFNISSVKNIANYLGTSSFDSLIEENNTTRHYIVSTSMSLVLAYDQNWEFLDFSNEIGVPTYVKIVNSKEIFLSSGVGVYKIDKDFNIESSFINYAVYGAIYYNKSNDLIYIASQQKRTIDIYNRNLTLINSFNIIGGSSPHGLIEYNGRLYVGLSNGKIDVYENGIRLTSTNTLCTGIIYLSVDDFDYLSISCNSKNIVYIYNMKNLTNTGYSISIPRPTYMNFDLNGRLVICSDNYFRIYY